MSVQLKEMFFVLLLIGAAAIFGAGSARAETKEMPKCEVKSGFSFHVTIGGVDYEKVGGFKPRAERRAAQLALDHKCSYDKLDGVTIPVCTVDTSIANWYVYADGVKVYESRAVDAADDAVRFANRLVIDGKCTRGKPWGMSPPSFGISDSTQEIIETSGAE